MPPHLHPRSTATSTLFAGTLLASFLVVGIPHLFPCPRPRRGYADAEVQFDKDGKPIRRKVRQIKADGASTLRDQESSDLKTTGIQQRPRSVRKGLAEHKNIEEEAALFRELQQEAELLQKVDKEARECPIPKPKGVLGRFLGFEDKKVAAVINAKS
jgi:cytochrome c oxidase assembly factor 2